MSPRKIRVGFYNQACALIHPTSGGEIWIGMISRVRESTFSMDLILSVNLL